MISFLGIIKNTCLYTIRSFVFQTLLALLILCSIGLPMILSGDGTPLSHIKITIDYTVWIISFILIASSLWLSCNIMSFDLDSYQMHMISVKPVSKSIVWLGKFTGLLIIHLILLFIAFTVFFIVLTFDIKSSNYSTETSNEIKEKIFTGRDDIFPNLTHINKAYKKEWETQKTELTKKGEILSKERLRKIKVAAYYQAMTQEGEIEPQKNRSFAFHDLKSTNTSDITLKFRIYVGDINMIERQNKPTASSFWEIKNPKTKKYDLINNSKMNYISNIFYELKLPAGYANENGIVTVRCVNKSNTSIFFQLNESPLFLVKKVSFLNNYVRAYLVIALSLVFILGIGCSFGSIFSYPIAVFTVISYLLVGSISNFILLTESSGNSLSVKNKFGDKLSSNILHLIIPLQKFESSNLLSSGQFISNKQIFNLIFYLILMKEFPLIIICIYIYSKRELGLIIKK